jgi:hypothetical protein
MSLSGDELRTFQESLESKTETGTSRPAPRKEIEWALIEIVILLTRIENTLAGLSK